MLHSKLDCVCTIFIVLKDTRQGSLHLFLINDRHDYLINIFYSDQDNLKLDYISNTDILTEIKHMHVHKKKNF